MNKLPNRDDDIAHSKDSDFKARLNDLQRQRGIVNPAANGKRESQLTASQKASQKATGIGFRVASDLVAGVLVGLGIGYGLDYWLDTKPWLMIVFFFAGAAAGMMNIWRMLNGYGMEVGYFKSPQKPKQPEE